jgi:hypothetical protein
MPVARKGWDALSPGYRDRIKKAGLTRQDYEAGQSLSKARGHQNTPEHPRQFDSKKYPKYAAERSKLTKELERKKEGMFYNSDRWSRTKSDRAIREKPPSMAMLRWALAADDEDLLDAIRESPETYHFLLYH